MKKTKKISNPALLRLVPSARSGADETAAVVVATVDAVSAVGVADAIVDHGTIVLVVKNAPRERRLRSEWRTLLSHRCLLKAMNSPFLKTERRAQIEHSVRTAVNVMAAENVVIDTVADGTEDVAAIVAMTVISEKKAQFPQQLKCLHRSPGIRSSMT